MLSGLASPAEAGFTKAGKRFAPRIMFGAGFFGIMLRDSSSGDNVRKRDRIVKDQCGGSEAPSVPSETSLRELLNQSRTGTNRCAGATFESEVR